MKFETYISEKKKKLTYLCNKCSNRWESTKEQKKCPDCGNKDIEMMFDIFGKFMKEAKLPDYKKAKVGSKRWMKIWKENPELQDEMLAWRKKKESKWLKSKEGTKFAVSESYFSDMSKIYKDMENVLKQLQKDKYPDFFVKDVKNLVDKWKGLVTKLA